MHLSVGAGVSAAAGIVGRTAEADLRAGTGGYAACYTYSCSKGIKSTCIVVLICMFCYCNIELACDLYLLSISTRLLMARKY